MGFARARLGGLGQRASRGARWGYHPPERQGDDSGIGLTATRVAAAAVAVATLAGCTATVGGRALKDPDVGPDDVIPALLEPGNYPTRPTPPLGAAGPIGVIVEGQRMAEYVIGPWEVDPTLLTANLDGTLVWKSAGAVAVALPDPAQQIAATHGFIVGFSSDRSSTEPFGRLKALTNAVMRFPDPAAADAAATELSRLPAAGFVTDKTPFAVPGHPQARATRGRLQDGTSVVESFTPHGPYVLFHYARAQENLDTAAQLVARALDLQAPRIDQFTPTDPARFADLPRDPSGLLARTLPVPPDTGTVHNGVWQPRAALHYQVDPVTSAELFGSAGLQLKAVGQAAVYQTADPAGAQRLMQGFLEAGTSRKDPPVPAAGVPGMPTAKCFDAGEPKPGRPRFSCVAVVDRYVISTAAAQDVDVQQRTAAQYLMLTAS